MERIEIEEASWTLELNIECPKCDDNFDYLDTEDYKYSGFEGLNHFGDNENLEIECPNCKAKLLIKNTVY